MIRLLITNQKVSKTKDHLWQTQFSALLYLLWNHIIVYKFLSDFRSQNVTLPFFLSIYKLNRWVQNWQACAWLRSGNKTPGWNRKPCLDHAASYKFCCVWLQGLAAMEPIIAAAKTMLESSTGLIQVARSLAVNPKDPPKWSVLAGHSRTVSDSIKKLITNMRYSQNV